MLNNKTSSNLPAFFTNFFFREYDEMLFGFLEIDVRIEINLYKSDHLDPQISKSQILL